MSRNYRVLFILCTFILVFITAAQVNTSVSAQTATPAPATPNPVDPTPTPQCPTGAVLNSFVVAQSGRVYDPETNETTFTYVICGTGTQPDLIHFTIEIPICGPPLIISNTSPANAVRFGLDPTTGLNGIIWDLPLQTSDSRTYSLTFLGNVAESSVQVAVNVDDFEIGALTGPSCNVASLAVDKLISTDQISWMDASDYPGPQLQVGVPVYYQFVARNIGNAELSGLTLTDSMYSTSACALPAVLPAGEFFSCVIGPIPAVQGLHTNTVTVSGTANGQTISATDSAYYVSGAVPLVRLEKLVSTDGVAWSDSVLVDDDEQVSYRFVVSNLGTTPLQGIVLTDPGFDTSACAVPETLAPAASFDCVIGPFPAAEQTFTNTATVTATFEAQTATDTNSASYARRGDDDDDDDDRPIIIIEGPVTSINVNIITIFDIDIEVDPNDSTLTQIEIGDIIRVVGEAQERGDTIIIVAITIINVNIDVIVIGAPGAPVYVPPGCRITGIGGNNPRLRCSGRDSSGRSSSSGRDS